MVSGALMAVSLGLVVHPRPAHACGGTFCDGGPNAMPVDQTGESIVFVQGDGFIEAHIQIQYDAESTAEQFAWLVPVTAVPELSVGSQSFLSALATSTAPQYGFSNNNEPCPFDDDDTAACGDDPNDAQGFKLDVGDSGGPTGPSVVARQIVGAFEMVVLDGGTAEAVMAWLDDNGFAQDPAAEPVLAEYLEEGQLFAAFKLTPNSDASEIHPIVLRYPSDEACVPIRLTRIAAVDDMPIRTYVLGDARAVPSNDRHVELNALELDFLNLADNYLEVVSLAVDEAGGHAWVTEYAGDSAVVPDDALPEASWELEAFVDHGARDTLAELSARGWLSCPEADCRWANPLLEGIVAAHLNVPPELDLDEVWACPDCFADELDRGRWDAQSFVVDVDERIVQPAQHAATLLGAYPYLTRMVTTLSPHEMTRDPVFGENPDLPDVVLTQELGRRNGFCNGESSFSLPDGRLVALPGGNWPEIEPESMPYAARIEQIASAGAPQVIIDNEPRIDELLTRFNDEHGARPPVDTACGEGTDDGSDDGSDGAPHWGDDVVVPGQRRDTGCACASTTDRVGWTATLFLIALGSRLRRRATAA